MTSNEIEDIFILERAEYLITKIIFGIDFPCVWNDFIAALSALQWNPQIWNYNKKHGIAHKTISDIFKCNRMWKIEKKYIASSSCKVFISFNNDNMVAAFSAEEREVLTALNILDERERLVAFSTADERDSSIHSSALLKKKNKLIKRTFK
jgi:hypothetical protein